MREELYNIYSKSGIRGSVIEYGEKICSSLKDTFDDIDRTAEINQLKVVNAMQECRASEACLLGTTGYGYNDIGRDTLEEIYAHIFNTEAALVRPSISCGTHALTIALRSVLRPGDELLSPVGLPYDTLQEVIGIRESVGSLKEFGISYRQADLLPDSSFDYDAIKASINEKTKLVTIQRSKGYDSRNSFLVEQIGELIKFIKGIKPDVYIMVDNCYGEFVQTIEPTDVGADMVVGSLIKNPGGGLAPMGGYIAGKKELIEKCAVMLTSPGLGKEVGATLDILPKLYQGLFMAPTITAAALKTAIFAANIYEKLGFSTHPLANSKRADIIQAITLGSEEGIKSFCAGIQAASPIDSHLTPEGWDMPGYDSPVIMAAGAFVSGSSIELSADAPMREPYNVYFQGGLTFPHGKYGILNTLEYMIQSGLVKEKDLC